MRAAAVLVLVAASDVDGAEVVHIGQRRPSDDGVAEGLEESVAVVVGQAVERRQAEPPGALQAVRPQQRAGDFLQAVDTVGIAGDGVDILLSVQRDAERQQEFDVAPAASRAAHRDRGLAAASSASCGVAIKCELMRGRRGSPGLIDSAASLSSSWATLSGTSMA